MRLSPKGCNHQNRPPANRPKIVSKLKKSLLYQEAIVFRYDVRVRLCFFLKIVKTFCITMILYLTEFCFAWSLLNPKLFLCQRGPKWIYWLKVCHLSEQHIFSTLWQVQYWGNGVLQYHNSHHAIIGCRPCQGKLKWLIMAQFLSKVRPPHGGSLM